MKFDRERFLNDLRALADQNVKWTHRGWTDPRIGFDCTGVVRYAVELQGVVLPEDLALAFENYRRPPNGRRMLATMRAWLPEVSVDELLPADLIVLFVRRNPCHMAIQMPDGLVAEAYESVEGATSRFLIRKPDPLRRIAACFRIPDEFQAA